MTGEFDPTRELFIAQLARPSELQSINLRTLSPFQRALLVIDGTVTEFLQAYTMEPVQVIRLSQTRQRLPEANEWLETAAGAPVLAREVMIRGKYSHTLHVYALSFVAAERLPAEVREELEGQGEGLGRILGKSDMETRREALWYGRQAENELPERVKERWSGEFIVRTYRIIWHGSPIMLIHEKFPLHPDPSPVHH